jgi:hypothetical protein
VIRQTADHKARVRPTTIFATFLLVFSWEICVPSDMEKELSTRWLAVITYMKVITPEEVYRVVRFKKLSHFDNKLHLLKSQILHTNTFRELTERPINSHNPHSTNCSQNDTASCW